MSAKTFENIGWARRLRVFGYAVACSLTAACVGEVEPAASPLVDDKQLSLEDVASEEVTLPDYPNKATIKRDANGAPHISARTEQEGYGALCYAMAEDRLFQLDFLRRSAQGRVSELRLPDASSHLDSDRLARVLNIPGLAEARLAKMGTVASGLVKACSAGINLFIAKGKLPPEFEALGYKPDPWKPADSLAIPMSIAANLDTGIFLTKVQYSALAFLVAPEVAAALIPPPPALSMFDAAGKLNPPQSFVANPGRGGNRRQSKIINAPRLKRGWRPPQRHSNGLGSVTGPESNNFAVDGRLTNTGRPMVANDPHLPLTTPTLAYAAQLEVDSNVNGQRMNVQGITFPGFPLFVSARTDTTSWAITFTLLDDVDLFQEQFSDDGTQALIKGKWTAVTTRSESIGVAGGEPVPITIAVTQHGPVLNAAFPALDAFGPIALQSTVAQQQWSIESLINLPRTRNWTQFLASARASSIGFNFLFSDETGSSGRIGYTASGLVPLRQNPDNAFGVVPGNDNLHEWTGFARPEQLPSVYDPPSHALATGNNRIVPDEYPIYLSNYYDTPWRTQRLYTRLLTGSPSFNVTSFSSIQLDTNSVISLPLRDMLVGAVNRAGLPGKDPAAMAAFAALKSWDGNSSANSQGAAVYETLLFLLIRNTVMQIDKDLYAGYASSVFITQQQQALRDLLESPRPPFFGATTVDEAASKRDRAVSDALRDADTLLREALGDNVAKWTWGGVHKLTYNHPLADPNRPSVYDLGSFAANGDASTPWIGGFFIQAALLGLPTEDLSAFGGLRAALAQDALPVVRAIWEPSSTTRSLVTLSTGESGDPSTSHFGDQADDWRAGKYLQFPFSH